jgi:hypothetical protein
LKEEIYDFSYGEKRVTVAVLSTDAYSLWSWVDIGEPKRMEIPENAAVLVTHGRKHRHEDRENDYGKVCIMSAMAGIYQEDAAKG